MIAILNLNLNPLKIIHNFNNNFSFLLKKILIKTVQLMSI